MLPYTSLPKRTRTVATVLIVIMRFEKEVHIAVSSIDIRPGGGKEKAYLAYKACPNLKQCTHTPIITGSASPHEAQSG